MRRLQSCHVLLLVVHHIATDGWSMNVIQNELTALYKAKVNNCNCVPLFLLSCKSVVNFIDRYYNMTYE